MPRPPPPAVALRMTGNSTFRAHSIASPSEAITGMDGVDVRDFGRADYSRDVEITQRQLRRSDANRLIGKTHVERIPVCLAVDRDRADAEFLACANDAQCNLAAIRYQNFLEHDVKALSCQLSGKSRDSTALDSPEG